MFACHVMLCQCQQYPFPCNIAQRPYIRFTWRFANLNTCIRTIKLGGFSTLCRAIWDFVSWIGPRAVQTERLTCPSISYFQQKSVVSRKSKSLLGLCHERGVFTVCYGLWSRTCVDFLLVGQNLVDLVFVSACVIQIPLDLLCSCFVSSVNTNKLL